MFRGLLWSLTETRSAAALRAEGCAGRFQPTQQSTRRPAPAAELAALYHEPWEIETAFDEFKTHLRGNQRVLRSKTPELVRQEAWGFLLAHFAIRALMHEAALGALPHARDADTLSFTHALRVTRRTLPHLAAIPPSGLAARAPGDPPRAARGVRPLQPRPRGAARREAQDD
jgi:hypothetical protein